MMENGVSIIIPTCNGGQIFSQCLSGLKRQDYAGPLQLIIVDSGSTDKTVELAMKAGAEVQRIDPKQFHHARTRNEALSLANHEKIVFTVQDAIPCSDIWLTSLVHALDDYPVAAVYTAQIPHDDATPYARFEIESINEARGHDPVIQETESLESYAEMPYNRAYRMIGLDNVCAIYRKDRLLREPFPEVDFAEDMAWAQKSLLMGHKILYNPRIQMKHSHNRPPQYAFCRQIINSFWCAKIMGRVEDDLSFLEVGDLKSLTGGALSFVSSLLSNIFSDEPEYPGGKSLLREILGKYPQDNWVKRFLVGRIYRRQKPMPERVKKLAGNMETGIGTLFHLIRGKYHMKDEKKQMLLLDQIVANVMGRAYGEVYASRLLKDNISPSLESLMRPFFHGV
ncbi:MAG: glycosyltransferase family 2 protein [Deltaproteobacteria bacterium]|nr:glycosyltransferase family 2 protein [Deltaproteobacteria bacterium]